MKLSTTLAAIVVAFSFAMPVTAATVYDATSAAKDTTYGQYSGGHSLYISGLKYTFEPGVGTFTVDGTTATLTGDLWLNGVVGGTGYAVDLSFDLYDPLPAGYGPKLELTAAAYNPGPGGIDPSSWDFWNLDETALVSTLTGLGTNAGQLFDVKSKPIDGPYTFQSGYGANGKNLNYGMSGWFYLVAQPDHQGDNPCALNSTGGSPVCDFNIDLNAVPVPASAILLLSGLVGGGLMRRRKSSSRRA